MADNNAQWFAKAVLRKVGSMEHAQEYFDSLKRAGYVVKGRILTLAETATALAKCRVHFGLGPRGGKSKATISRVKAQKGRPAEEQKIVKEMEFYRVKASKLRASKRKLDDKLAKDAARAKSSPSLFDITKKAKAQVMELTQGLDIPDSLRYEIIRKAQDSSKLGLVLGLVEKFVADRPTLKDPVSWLRNGLYSLKEPVPRSHPEVPRPAAWSRMAAEAEAEARLSMDNDGCN